MENRQYDIKAKHLQNITFHNLYQVRNSTSVENTNILRFNPFALAVQSADVLSLNGNGRQRYAQYA